MEADKNHVLLLYLMVLLVEIWNVSILSVVIANNVPDVRFSPGPRKLLATNRSPEGATQTSRSEEASVLARRLKT